jgi:hypothetical protein
MLNTSSNKAPFIEKLWEFPLCNQVQDSATHLLFQCCFSMMIWTDILSWSGFQDISATAWANYAIANVIAKEWWMNLVMTCERVRKALASMIILVSWETWKERNTRVFNHHAMPSHILIESSARSKWMQDL